MTLLSEVFTSLRQVFSLVVPKTPSPWETHIDVLVPQALSSRDNIGSALSRIREIITERMPRAVVNVEVATDGQRPGIYCGVSCDPTDTSDEDGEISRYLERRGFRTASSAVHDVLGRDVLNELMALPTPDADPSPQIRM